MGQSCPLGMTPQQLVDQASERTGIEFDDEPYFQRLRMMHGSLSEEADLHEVGAQSKATQLLRYLCNRLRMQRDYARHPEIAEQKIIAPIIVTGLARSGTTKVQKLLAASGDFNWLPYWQTYNPSLITGSRHESPKARMEEADQFCRWLDEASPETKLGHAFETFEPEEDSLLEEHCLLSPSFVAYANVPSYLGWLAGQDITPMFEYLKDVLKYLQWQGLASSGKRWVLKAPTYIGFEPCLLKVFPDARVVMTHRSPLETVASGCKLVHCFRKPYTDTTYQGIGPELNAGFSMAIRQHLDNRRAIGGLSLLDLHFNEITRSVDTAVRKIYAHCDAGLSESSMRRMVDWDQSHPPHLKGKFHYSLSEYQLSEETVTGSFPEYIQLVDRIEQPTGR